MSFFGTVFKFLSGNSIGSSLAKVALLGFASRLLNKNISNATNSSNKPQPDPGARQQLNASLDNSIPVLYGEAFFGGNLVDASLSADLKTMKYVLALSETTGNLLSTSSGSSYTFNGVYFNNNRVVFKADGVTVDYTLDNSGNQDISFRDLAKVYFYVNNTPTQPTGYSGTTPASTVVMPSWTTGSWPMTGLIFAIIEIRYNRANNVTGLPTCTFHVTNSMKLPGDVLNDYMQNTRYGASIASSEINNSLVALNSFCLAGFTYTDANSQVQTGTIEINGLVNTNTNVLDNMEQMAIAGSSFLTYDIHAGQWGVVIDQAGNSTVSFNDSNIIGEIAVSGTSLTQLYNSVDIKFANSDILDQTDVAKISIPSEDQYQNEIPNVMQVSLPYSNKQSVALKLGLQQLKQSRVDKIITFTTDYSYINVNAGDIIDVTSAVYGFTNKKFRVITAEETDNDQGGIEITFTCLEYDEDVYEYDIQEYAVETEDGILSAGSIGKPDVPIVTLYQQSNTPRIVVAADVPSGIVDTMEFWLTFDVNVPVDANRTYTQIGTYSNPDGSLLTENQTVSFTYNSLSASNFFIKVRGANSLRSGPYSDPTGLIAYQPVVVADTLSDVPVSFGGQLMTLGLLTLLNNLDDLLKLGNNTGVLDTIADIFFPDRTGNSYVASEILSNDPGFISSVGNATTDVSNYGIENLNNVSNVAATNGQILVYREEDGKWVPADNCCTVIVPPVPQPPPVITPVLRTQVKLPPDRGSWADPTGIPTVFASDEAPVTGSYYVTWYAVPAVYNDLSGSFFVNAVIDTSKNAYLYKSNGTLIETLSGSACSTNYNVLELPFADREPGCDYYILLDQGFLTHCEWTSEAITVGQWNFNTPKYYVDPYTAPDPTIGSYNPPALDPPEVQAAPLSGNICVPAQIEILWDEDIVFGGGTVSITDLSSNTVVGSQTGTSATGTNRYQIFSGGLTSGLQRGKNYRLDIGANVVQSNVVVEYACDYTYYYPQVPNEPTSYTFSTLAPIELIDYYIKTINGNNGNTNADVETNITLVFNQPVRLSTTTSYISLYAQGGTLLQSIDVSASFDPEKVYELVVASGNTVVINKTCDFESGSNFYVTVDPNAIYDYCNAGWGGTTSISEITFSTAAGPIADSVSPAPGSVGIPTGNITYNFPDPGIRRGYGNILLVDGNGNTIKTMAWDDPAISYG